MQFREDSVFNTFVFDDFGKKYITRVAKVSACMYL